MRPCCRAVAGIWLTASSISGRRMRLLAPPEDRSRSSLVQTSVGRPGSSLLVSRRRSLCRGLPMTGRTVLLWADERPEQESSHHSRVGDEAASGAAGRGWVGAEEQSAWCALGLRRIQTRLVRATEWVLVPAELASPTSCRSRVMPLDLAVRWELVQAGLDNVGIEVQGLRQARSPAVLPGAGRGSGRVRDLPRLMTSR